MRVGEDFIKAPISRTKELQFLQLITKPYRITDKRVFMKINFEEIAREKDLVVINTTSQSNGYPSHEMKALIGFNNFEQAEALAHEYDLDVMVFTRRSGWHYWYRTGQQPFGPFERSSEDFGDGFDTYGKSDLETFFEDEVQSQVECFENFQSLREFLDKQEKIFNEIKKLGEDELVVTCDCCYYDTIKKTTMEYSYDTVHYAIGLVDMDTLFAEE